MIIHRSNFNVTRHDAEPDKTPSAASSLPPKSPQAPPAVTGGSGIPGDIVYGARAIARFMFEEDGDRARRRVFNIWTHHRDRRENAGFFKMKGALCLSKRRWRDFHGLG